MRRVMIAVNPRSQIIAYKAPLFQKCIETLCTGIHLSHCLVAPPYWSIGRSVPIGSGSTLCSMAFLAWSAVRAAVPCQTFALTIQRASDNRQREVPVPKKKATHLPHHFHPLPAQYGPS
jgi:hypothetical protein